MQIGESIDMGREILEKNAIPETIFQYANKFLEILHLI